MKYDKAQAAIWRPPVDVPLENQADRVRELVDRREDLLGAWLQDLGHHL